MKAEFATLYNTISEKRHPAFGTYNTEESMTQQSDKDSTDINLIVKRYEATGMLPQVKLEAISGDFTDIGDFHDAQQRILAAKEAFQEVPAKIRDQFDNDPVKFVEFATNKDNADALREMGLANPLPEPQDTRTTTTSSHAEEEHYGHNDRSEQPAERRERRIATEANLDAGKRREALREREELRPDGDRESGRGRTLR